ncbi:MAG: VWA domain-containing protein [Endomicrobium sp.]|jgi:Ca-activated chloride channel family protein|nr:VWA domain-containing protein [Endomicrobium sp.]
MRFANPIFLPIFIFLLGVVYAALNVIFKNRKETFIDFSAAGNFKGEEPKIKKTLLKIVEILKYAALVLIIIALARPQEGKTYEQTNDSGIEIMIALDTSTSMRSLDFNPLNRMDAAKNAAEEFIKARKYDRIGLVVFSGLAFTQCPPTTDKDSLAKFVKNVNIGDTGLDGTAIGSAIMTSINRLQNGSAKSKVIILITDGNNNMGEIDPITASKAAADYGIKIYAIGVGSAEGAVYETDDPFFGKRLVRVAEDKINESVLKEAAQNTGGRYFRAQDSKSFEEIMKQIDSLEKEDIKVVQFTTYNEFYKLFAFIAFLILLLTAILENVYLRKLP